MAEPRSGDDLAELLMEKAAGGERFSSALSTKTTFRRRAWLSRPARVEKMIKAVLAHHEVSYESTHNIAYLLTLLDGAGIPKPDNAIDLPNLSPWAAELRYARRPEAVPDRASMRSSIEQTREWAEAQLG